MYISKNLLAVGDFQNATKNKSAYEGGSIFHLPYPRIRVMILLEQLEG